MPSHGALDCASRWCHTCPHGFREGADCLASDTILAQVDAYNRSSREALDWLDTADAYGLDADTTVRDWHDMTHPEHWLGEQ